MKIILESTKQVVHGEPGLSGARSEDVTWAVEFTGDPNEEREWIFTFGYGHAHPVTGEPLHDRFVRRRGTFMSARLEMLSLFGQKWSMQYRTEEDAGVERFHLRELEITEPARDADGKLVTVEIRAKEES